MNNKNKLLIITIFIIIILCVFSSCNDYDVIYYENILEESTVKQFELKKELVDLEQRYTLCYQDKNLENIVFNYSYPVQNTNTEKIELKFLDSDSWMKELFPNHIYTFSNKESTWLYPQNINDGILGINDTGKSIELYFKENMSLKLENIKYDDSSDMKREYLSYKGTTKNLKIYNTISGLLGEIYIKEKDDMPSWIINSNDFVLNNINDYYLPFYNNLSDKNDIEFIFQALGIIDANNKFHEYKITTTGKEVDVLTKTKDNICYPIKLYFSLERYSSKAIIDSQTNSHENNAYLKSYVVLGKHSMYGESELNIRFSTSFLPNIKNNDIQNVYLRIKSFDKEKYRISAYYLNEDWCSWTIDKMNKPTIGNLIGESKLKNGYYYIDITELYKLYLGIENERLTEIGIRLIAHKGCVVLPTADNSVFPISVVVKYK